MQPHRQPSRPPQWGDPPMSAMSSAATAATAAAAAVQAAPAAATALAALAGRDYVIPDDVKMLAESALAHRLIIKTSSSMHDIDPRQVVAEILSTVPVEDARGASADRKGAAAQWTQATARRGATGSLAQ